MSTASQPTSDAPGGEEVAQAAKDVSQRSTVTATTSSQTIAEAKQSQQQQQQQQQQQEPPPQQQQQQQGQGQVLSKSQQKKQRKKQKEEAAQQASSQGGQADVSQQASGQAGQADASQQASSQGGQAAVSSPDVSQQTQPQSQQQPHLGSEQYIQKSPAAVTKNSATEPSQNANQEAGLEEALPDNAEEAARREASWRETARAEEGERQRRIEENKRLDARAEEKEASLIGTVVDEERERERRVAQDYENYTEPLDKTKALEEIERKRRLYSKAERSRQELAAANSAKLFPNAPRPAYSSFNLWNANNLIKQTPSTTPSTSSSSTYQTTKQEQPRYAEFVSTTTRTSRSQPAPEQYSRIASVSENAPGVHVLHKTQFLKPYSREPAEIKIIEGEDVPPTTTVTVSRPGDPLAPGFITKEMYRTQIRPRLVVRHQGLMGKWKRGTETVRFDDL